MKKITCKAVELLKVTLNKGDVSMRSNWNADQLLSAHLLYILQNISKNCDVSSVMTYASKSEGEIAINKMDIVHKINVLRNTCNKTEAKDLVKSTFFVQLCWFLAQDMEINITN